MKKLIAALGVLVIALAIALQPTKVVADADVSAAAAFINKDFGCGMFDGNGGFVVSFDGNHSVVTSSNHTTLICKGEGAPSSTGRAVVTRGFGCGTFLGFTTDSQNTVSASGKITLRCRI